MKKLWLVSAVLLFLPQKGDSFIPISPWAGELYEFKFEGLWQWSHYPSIANSTQKFKSTTRLLQFDLGVSPLETWDVTAEVEFFATSRVNWTTRSYGVGIKKQILDDLTGDPVALSVLGKIRYVPSQSLDQISSPYSAPMNYSLGISVGREWSAEGYWTAKIIGYAELGLGSQGSPWNYDLIGFSMMLGRVHEVSGSVDAYLGFGPRNQVNPNHFFGWGKYSHRSSDLRIAYIRHLQIWGEWGVAYTERLYAFCYPEHFRAIEVYYQLPFSLF